MTWVTEETALATGRRLTFPGIGLMFIDADNVSSGTGYARFVRQGVAARTEDLSATKGDPVCVASQRPLSLDGAGRHPNARQFKHPASRSVRELGIQ
ncbi:hypothetical protein IM660_10635 [Ruania alkalisoli]|uniref:Uncharacterized protein n=1 Tax=Ruania alkalisoli TaxID=2779775 RepID=A0A7M1SRG5_9MICO|nr:hypothetical protein [Ruania alkalisoli]QOR69183.1 hypothetical protein IM660_10635 [Ruania alkalisoli]